mgnify:CR=1 FL=1
MSKYNLDCLGEACPTPLIKVQNKIEEMKVGDILIVNVDHSCAMKNVPNWAMEEGYNVEVESTYNGEWNIVIEKTK